MVKQQYSKLAKLIMLRNGFQLSVKRKKQIIEYRENMTAIIERYINAIGGIPMYSLNFLKTTNKKKAVTKAPKLSNSVSAAGK